VHKLKSPLPALAAQVAAVFKLLPLSRRLLLIIWPFLAIVIVLVWLISESLIILGSTRAYSTRHLRAVTAP